MSALRIAIIGPGRMGHEVENAAHDCGAEVVAMLGPDTPIDARSLAGAQVAIEFTEPAAAVANIEATVRTGVPIVVGTTGWHHRLDEVGAFVRENGGAMLWASNFSLGVHVLARILREAGGMLGSLPGFAGALIETHHSAKKDAPSGTAIMLRAELARGSGLNVPITSVRVGSVPGTHEIVLDGQFEQIVIRHEARDRRVFAAGAIVAASWLVGRTGVFTMSDVLTEAGK